MSDVTPRAGPFVGLRVLEFAGLGPAPHCAMMLGDLGASVLTVERPEPGARGPARERRHQPQLRSRIGTVAIDLKSASTRPRVESLIEKADVLIEGFRPDVMERLGIGADRCLELNPRLIYAAVTGWGRRGPWSHRAGHDLNYLAASGLLALIGRSGQPPTVPLNLLGDYGGGSMLASFGIAAALYERERSGRGQVLDIAMADGAALLGTTVFGAWAAGHWRAQRGTNLLDGGAPWYDVYETADGRFMAVGALEDQFYEQLLIGLGLDATDLPSRRDRSQWSDLRTRFEQRFSQRTLAEWAIVFESLDACVTPVLDPSEAASHVHASCREAFVAIDGVTQPAVAPRFSRTPGAIHAAPPSPDVLPDDWR